MNNYKSTDKYHVKRCCFCDKKWVEKHGTDGSANVVDISEEELKHKGIPYEEETYFCDSKQCWRIYRSCIETEELMWGED